MTPYIQNSVEGLCPVPPWGICDADYIKMWAS